MIYVFYLANLAVLGSSVLVFQLSTNEKRFSFSLLRGMAILPILAAEYFCLAQFQEPVFIPLIFLSENLTALMWYGQAHWMSRAAETCPVKSSRFVWFEAVAVIVISALLLTLERWGYAALSENRTVFFHKNLLFLAVQLFILISAVTMGWRLEAFWRLLTPAQRWEYKYLVGGSYLACGALGWAVSYRLTYHAMNTDHFHLLFWLLICAWIMITYAVIHHRLLNRRLFVSRKVVYVFVAPLVFGLYLIAIGLVVLVMRLFNLPMPVVVKWLLCIAGLMALLMMAVSGKVRHRVKYFISTHFYTNKYEYRDEWLGFSRMLQGAVSESEVVDALQEVMGKSLYTNTLAIWTGDDAEGYRLTFYKGAGTLPADSCHLPGDDPLVVHLRTHGRYLREKEDRTDRRPEKTLGSEAPFQELNLVLYESLTIGEQMVGILGIGAEFTGGRYGRDDFDLLAAIGTQAASAILAARMAESLAKTRQQEAWDVMAAFILHDIKNAASMLSLIRQNAPNHLQDPEFQADLLETIDDAVRRMDKVQTRLSTLKQEVIPVWRTVDVPQYLTDSFRRLEKRLPGVIINFHDGKTDDAFIRTDPDLLYRILENLLLNALEAGGGGTVVDVWIRSEGNQYMAITFSDNGPGIPESLLPEGVFEPFRTTKEKGTGIGLWQVRRMVLILGGLISAQNNPTGGACFTLRFPMDRGGSPL